MVTATTMVAATAAAMKTTTATAAVKTTAIRIGGGRSHQRCNRRRECCRPQNPHNSYHLTILH
jgi:hypothetical protein